MCILCTQSIFMQGTHSKGIDFLLFFVKLFSESAFTQRSFVQMDILCTHPMFGPDSGSGSWNSLNFMYEKVRMGAGANRRKRVDAFLQASCALANASPGKALLRTCPVCTHVTRLMI